MIFLSELQGFKNAFIYYPTTPHVYKQSSGNSYENPHCLWSPRSTPIHVICDLDYKFIGIEVQNFYAVQLHYDNCRVDANFNSEDDAKNLVSILEAMAIAKMTPKGEEL